MKANFDTINAPGLVNGGVRRSDRTTVPLPVRVQSGNFEEISTTLNASFDGVYFRTRISLYRVGMDLVVTLPYSTETEFCAQFFGKVVRIDSPSDGQFGIAVELIAAKPNLSNPGQTLPALGEQSESAKKLKYGWQQAVHDVFSETRPDFVSWKVNLAQRAIAARLCEKTPTDNEEVIAIREALKSLRALLPERNQRTSAACDKEDVA